MTVDDISNELDKIDYKSLFSAFLREYEYEDYVYYGKDNLLDIKTYRDNDNILKSKIEKLYAIGMSGEIWEQNNNGRTFRHISLNRKFDGNDKLRLYLCPTDNYVYFIIDELIKKCANGKEEIYLKYSRENRYDKVVLFLRNSNDLNSKIELLDEIKREHPAWFEHMSKAPHWISESHLKGVYIAPEKCVKRDINSDFNSYTYAFMHLMNNVRNEMLFTYRTKDFEVLKSKPVDELFDSFKRCFNRELCKMGLYNFYDKNGQLVSCVSSLFPGYGKSLDEDIRLVDDGLEIGKRIDDKNKKYYKIPFGSTIPSKLEDYNNFKYFVMDDQTYLRKKFYPHLYGSIEEASHEAR